MPTTQVSSMHKRELANLATRQPQFVAQLQNQLQDDRGSCTIILYYCTPPSLAADKEQTKPKF